MNPFKVLLKHLRDASVPEPKLRYNLTPRAETVLQIADKEARRLKQDAIRPEHVLYGIATLGKGVAATVLKRCGVDVNSVVRELEGTHNKSEEGETSSTLSFSEEMNQVLKIAENERRALYHTYLGTEHLLLALLQYQTPATERIVRSLALDVTEVRREVLKELDPNFGAEG